MSTSPAPHGSRTRRFVAARLDRTSYLGLHLTLGLVGALLALWLVGALIEEVLDNAGLVRWDMATSAAVHARTTPAGLAVFDVVTQLGSPVAMVLLGVVGAFWLWRRAPRLTFYVWCAAFVGGGVLSEAIKLAVHRTRPEYAARYLHGHSYSFPSGHTMGATIGYVMLAFALRHHIRDDPASAAGAAPGRWIYLLAIAGALLVGLSRVYLGVHYPSDVAGGYLAAAAWLAICLTGHGVARGRARHARDAAPAP